MAGKKTFLLLVGYAAVFFACATQVASPGMTLWAGLNNYHETMRTLEARPERWPDRQRLAESIKTTYVATLGGSREFNRLVDLDLKRREFIIAQREGGLKPDRARQIEQELIKLNEQIEGVLPVVKTQVMNGPLRHQEGSQTIETVATMGLLHLAIEAFSPSPQPRGPSQSTTQIGPYLVIDEGVSSSVRTPEGKTFRCVTNIVPEQGVFMRCNDGGARS